MIGHPIGSSTYPFAAGLKVLPASGFLRRSTESYIMADNTLVVWSLTALVYALQGVTWHDDPDHCRTWTGDWASGACRCDVEPTP